MGWRSLYWLIHEGGGNLRHEEIHDSALDSQCEFPEVYPVQAQTLD